MGALAALLLAGCGAKAVDCSDADAQSTTAALLQDQITKAAIRMATGDDGDRVATDAKIRATVAQLRITLTDIRTTKRDPNSTKRFCVATARIVVPDNIVSDSDRVRELASAPSVERTALRLGMEREADALTYSVEYNVQPTDDGKKVYAELDRGGEPPLEFLGEVVISHLARRSVESAQAQAAAAEDAAAAAQAQQQQASLQADLDMAMAENKLTKQYLNELWKAIPAHYQNQLVDMQTAWVKKKNADCALEAAGAATEPLAREAVRVRCDTRLNRTRANELRPYATGG